MQVAILEEMKQNVAGSEAAAGPPHDQQPAEKTALTAMGCLFGETYCTDSPDQDINLLVQREMSMYEQESPIQCLQVTCSTKSSHVVENFGVWEIPSRRPDGK